MMQQERGNTLLIAVGNTLRGDDGIGHWVVAQIEKKKLPKVTVRYMQQLHIDLLEELGRFDTVIVADAAIQEAPATLEPIAIKDEGLSSSHRADAATLKSLHHKLYQQSLQWMACGIKATDFDMGESISKATLKNGEKALDLLLAFLR
jgi:hydrogenase maturation protease